MKTRSKIVQNSKYMLANWREWDRKSVVYLVIRIPCQVILPLITALAPKIMIDCIERKVSISYLVTAIGILSLLIASLSWLVPYMQEKMDGSARITRMRYAVNAFEKTMATDFINVESLEGRKKLERSKDFYYSGNSGGAGFYDCVCQLAVCAAGIVASLALLYRLHPIMLLIIAATCFGEFFMLRMINKAEQRMKDDSNPIFLKYNYFYKISHDFSAGKDIRIYEAGAWFQKMMAQALNAHIKLLSRFTRQVLTVTAARAALNLMRESIAYIYLIYCVWNQRITVSDFIFYFGIVTGFSGWVLGLIQQYSTLERCALECEKYREYVTMPEPSETSAVTDSPPAKIENIELIAVDFCYQGSSAMAIQNLSFQVNTGENIAIVGENGAGKTTAIKLLCGLYQPTNGEILINGKNANELSRQAYFSLFSVSFQDYHFLPMSIAENIALNQETDIDWVKLERVLEQAGILKRLRNLPDGLHTKMNKEVFRDAVDFSGGEKQKLLLARALYKEAPILILDEPTAALDPIAEKELYLKYKEMADGKTTFFISHRLSSTRFCDRILFLSNGTVTESGTHDMLMSQRGSYYRMFQMQSYYYREGEHMI